MRKQKKEKEIVRGVGRGGKIVSYIVMIEIGRAHV